MLGVAATGSLLGSCAPGSKEAKKMMPSPSGLKMYWGDLHNHCNLTYGHGDMRDAFELFPRVLEVLMCEHRVVLSHMIRNDHRRCF